MSFLHNYFENIYAFRKILLDKDVSFTYNSFWTFIFSTTYFGRNAFHFSSQTHDGRRVRQSLYNPHWNTTKNFVFETSEYKLS